MNLRESDRVVRTLQTECDAPKRHPLAYLKNSSSKVYKIAIIRNRKKISNLVSSQSNLRDQNKLAHFDFFSRLVFLITTNTSILQHERLKSVLRI